MCPMDITNSIITASSTLLAVGITLYFTNRREKNKFLQDLKLKEYIESLLSGKPEYLQSPAPNCQLVNTHVLCFQK